MYEISLLNLEFSFFNFKPITIQLRPLIIFEVKNSFLGAVWSTNFCRINNSISTVRHY